MNLTHILLHRYEFEEHALWCILPRRRRCQFRPEASSVGLYRSLTVLAMLGSLRSLIGLMNQDDRRQASLMFVLMLATALSEVAGVASIMPFLAVLSNPTLIDSNLYLRAIYESLAFATRDSFLMALGAAFFAVLICSLLLKGFSAYVQFKFSFGLSVSWSVRLVRAYLKQGYAWFLQKNSSDLATTVLSEVDVVVSGALLPGMQALAQGIVAVSLMLLLISIDPVLAVSVGVVFGGGFAGISSYFRLSLERASAKRYRANRERYRVIQEGFGGVKDIKLGGLELATVQRFSAPSDERMAWNLRVAMIEQLPSLAMQALLFGGMLLVIMYLISRRGSFQEAIPIVGLYAFAGYRLLPAVQRVYEGITKIQSSRSSIEAIGAEIRALEIPGHSINEIELLGPPLQLKKTLNLEEVYFKYPEASVPALRGVSLQIEAHTSIGLVGPTGSGKTTLVDLLLGLLLPDSGRMLIDGNEVAAGNIRQWQRTVGYVPQQIFLVDDSIAANIAFGCSLDAIDYVAVERAARMADLHSFVTTELENGYNTLVGERGVRLSGGQRQRIGIARALYKNPDVLIMDEATSALDNVTEHVVMDAVRSLKSKKTIVLVAHRLSTVRDCQKIFVMNGGRIVASGNYEELVANNEQFRKLASLG